MYVHSPVIVTSIIVRTIFSRRRPNSHCESSSRSFIVTLKILSISSVLSVHISLEPSILPTRSIGSLIGKKKQKRNTELGERDRRKKKYPKKSCLRPGHQKLFHGGDPPRSIPARKGTLSSSSSSSFPF